MISSTSANHSAILLPPGGETSWRRTIAPGADLPQDGPGQPPDPPIPEVAGPAAEGDALHAQLVQHPGQPGVGDPHGRPEQAGPDAKAGQDGLGTDDLIGQPCSGAQHQQGM